MPSEHQANTPDHARLLRALNWYAQQAKAMQRATLRVDNKAALRIMKELALDGGSRAREAQQ